MKRKVVYIVVAIISIGVFYFRCQGQVNGFKYKPIPKEYLVNNSNDSFRSKADMLIKSATDLTTLLPSDYAKDGSVDYTTYLQQGLDKYKNVVFPDFPVLVNEQGLMIRDGSTVVFRPHSKLLLKPNGLERYGVLKIYGVQGVELYYPVVIGDVKGHTGKTGEWGMGIDIRSAKNITIINPVVSQCWGDGICIGQIDAKRNYSENITIYNAVLDNNRRNGISIGSVKGIKLIRPLVANSYGTLPMAGIDIEPNGNYNTIQDVVISDAITFNNAKIGLIVNLSVLTGKEQKEVNISVENHLDDGSNTGFYISGVRKPKSGPPLKGMIEIKKPTWKNNVHPCQIGQSFEYSPDIRFSGISINKAGNARQLKSQHNNEVESLKKTLNKVSKIKIVE